MNHGSRIKGILALSAASAVLSFLWFAFRSSQVVTIERVSERGSEMCVEGTFRNSTSASMVCLTQGRSPELAGYPVVLNPWGWGEPLEAMRCGVGMLDRVVEPGEIVTVKCIVRRREPWRMAVDYYQPGTLDRISQTLPFWVLRLLGLSTPPSGWHVASSRTIRPIVANNKP